MISDSCLSCGNGSYRTRLQIYPSVLYFDIESKARSPSLDIILIDFNPIKYLYHILDKFNKTLFISPGISYAIMRLS